LIAIGTHVRKRKNRDGGDVGQRQAFDSRIEEYRGVLAFIASRVLGGRKGVEEAVRSCLLAAEHTSTGHLSRGELGSLLLRTVIDEALFIRERERERS
jgi:hypothetical protein